MLRALLILTAQDCQERENENHRSARATTSPRIVYRHAGVHHNICTSLCWRNSVNARVDHARGEQILGKSLGCHYSNAKVESLLPHADTGGCLTHRQHLHLLYVPVSIPAFNSRTIVARKAFIHGTQPTQENINNSTPFLHSVHLSETVRRRNSDTQVGFHLLHADGRRCGPTRPHLYLCR